VFFLFSANRLDLFASTPEAMGPWRSIKVKEEMCSVGSDVNKDLGLKAKDKD